MSLKRVLLPLLFSVLLSSPQIGASIFYVDNQNGAASDSNSGSASQPWKTIQKAASTAAAGDTVYVQPGVYNEFINIANSGSAGSPITFEGVNSNGQWLTIVDPSTPMTNNWVPAPEVGAGVWKNTQGSFETHEMTIDGKRIAFVWTNGNMQASIDAAYYNSGLTNGFDLMVLASNAMMIAPSGRISVPFWDGVEALYCAWYHTNFIRFRDGRNPNGLNIRVAPNRDGSETSDLDKPALTIIGKSYVTWRNFKMRGSIGCIDMEGATAHDNTIEGNYLAGGVIRILLAGGAFNNLIRSNYLTTDYYGFTNLGAWGGGTQPLYAVRQSLWGVSKFLMGGASVNDHGIKAVGAGSSNVFSRNIIFQGLGEGILVGNVPPGAPLVGTSIYQNTISNLVSHGIMFWPLEVGTVAYQNLISDCNYNMRYHIMDQEGETNRTVYVYRNRLSLPHGVGGHIYTHFDNVSGTPYHPTFWTYHNSFSGGQAGLQVSSYAAGNGGIPNCRFVNNIFSDTYYLGQNATIDFMTNSSMVGAFDYNLVTPPWMTYPSTSDPAWFGSHNIKSSSIVWTNQANASLLLYAGSPAIGNALDVSTNFTLNGSSFPGLTEAAVKKTNSWAIGALEYPSAPAPPSNVHVVDPTQ